MATDKISFMKEALDQNNEPGGTKDIVTPPASIVPFADWQYYYIRDPIGWSAGAGERMRPPEVTVPVGFVTDLASIPSIFWSALPRTELYSYPAIIHDYLYWFQPCERDEADAILKAAMRDMGVSEATILIIYAAVRAAGSSAWNTNRELRDAGERRVLSKFPTNVLTTWEHWKTQPNVFKVDLAAGDSSPEGPRT